MDYLGYLETKFTQEQLIVGGEKITNEYINDLLSFMNLISGAIAYRDSLKEEEIKLKNKKKQKRETILREIRKMNNLIQEYDGRLKEEVSLFDEDVKNFLKTMYEFSKIEQTKNK